MNLCMQDALLINEFICAFSMRCNHTNISDQKTGIILFQNILTFAITNNLG